MDPRFGRAAYFIILDTETMDFEAVAKTQSLNLPQGAGIQAGKALADHRVDVLITGHCGPKAFKVLQNAGVSIVTAAGGKVAGAVDQFLKGELVLKGELAVASAADVEGHWV
ncbi:MAG: NifB/NifX family molybdenum-iron cluster-binding protein [Desulfobacterales bacterium]